MVNFQGNDSAIANKAGEAYSKAKEAADETKKRIEDTAYELGDKLRDNLHNIQEKTVNGYDYVESCIKTKPMMSAGVAFLLGMAVSKLLSKNQ
jgi:ElaB/YqjD/DUF883 family membrane-anchored ribosome-binding protein